MQAATPQIPACPDSASDSSTQTMFRKPKANVLLESTWEEEDMLRHQRHTRKNKDPDGVEEIACPRPKEVKVKKIKSKWERKDKKFLFSEDDKHSLLTGAKPQHSNGPHKESEEGERGKTYMAKGQCLWESITMTMKQITPNRKLDKMEGWETAQITKQDMTLSEMHPSWTGLDDDSSKYTSLLEPQKHGLWWTVRAKGKLAVIRRRSYGNVSERWEGLK